MSLRIMSSFLDIWASWSLASWKKFWRNVADVSVGSRANWSGSSSRQGDDVPFFESDRVEDDDSVVDMLR